MSKRSLRPDPNFDQLVEKIFPNRDEYEAHQESILESLSKSHSQNFITSITRKYYLVSRGSQPKYRDQ